MMKGLTSDQEQPLANQIVKAQQQIAKLRKQIVAAFRRHCILWWATHHPAIDAMLQQAVGILDGTARILTKCRLVCDESLPVPAQSFPLVGALQPILGRDIQIGDSFWDMKDDAQAASLVHEGTHIGGAATDIAYFWQHAKAPETVHRWGLPWGWDCIASTYDSWILNGFFVPGLDPTATVPACDVWATDETIRGTTRGGWVPIPPKSALYRTLNSGWLGYVCGN
jgi:hypothetical protein